MASLIQALIGSILLLALPLWKKAHGEETIQAEKKMKVLPISQTLRIPGALMTCLLFLTFCAIGVICGGWGATYIVEAKRMSAAQKPEQAGVKRAGRLGLGISVGSGDTHDPGADAPAHQLAELAQDQLHDLHAVARGELVELVDADHHRADVGLAPARLGHRLGAVVRHSDTVCRQGGDEFIALLPALEDPEQASVVGRKI